MQLSYLTMKLKEPEITEDLAQLKSNCHNMSLVIFLLFNRKYLQFPIIFQVVKHLRYYPEK